MTAIPKPELSLILADPAPQPASAPAPKLKSDPTRTKAIKRCLAAWRRSFNAYMVDSDPDSMDKVLDRKSVV